ncbi:Hypothetical protein PHPALM_18106 [Phytophthora palmivora]|uniref:B9 domain-containing protein 2 n=1 Tax=Phytophthora palmivora TaxID=4796 RepID=A0A2P4XKN2_9STRA|nr:Hypothetical protein PHPALM_18106 [Phytophthora palmivora]
MLKKLASPKKRAQPAVPRTDSLDAGAQVTSLEKETKSKAKPKEKSKPSKEKKSKTKTDGDLLGLGDAAAEVSREDAKEADNTGVLATEAKTPSPRKSIARAFRRKMPSDRDNVPEEKSSIKKPLASPKKKLTKLPKPEKKSKLVDKTREAKAHDEVLDPSADPGAATEKDPLTPSKRDTAVESPKRKSRWKLPHSSKSSNNQKDQKELIHDEKDSESTKGPLSPSSDNNATGSRDNSPSPRARGKKNKRDKRQLSAVDSSSGDSDQENQTNILSPLRRHKADPDDTLPIPESPYNPYRVQKRLTQLDVPPFYQPEVHLIGEIVSGHGFGTTGGLTCKWRVEYGSRWSHIAGDQFGQTQLDYPSTAPWTSDPDVAVWSHPIDLHFATSAFQGWPKLLLQVWRADTSMKKHVVGYGFVPIPFAAGQHKLWVSLWRPLGTTKEELDVQLLGRTPELKSEDMLFSAAWSERCRLRTVSTGKVLVHISVLLRHFQAGVIEA